MVVRGVKVSEFVIKNAKTEFNFSNNVLPDFSYHMLYTSIYHTVPDGINLLAIFIRTFPNWQGVIDISIGECNTILSAYTKYRHLG